MPKSRPNLSWIGHTIGGRYQIEALLGQGGMSAVYKAIDPNLQRTVAVKLIHPHLSTDSQFVRRFEQEAAAVARLRHPNIIQVYDFNHDGDVYYMVLEFVPGETLQQKLAALDAGGQQFSVAETISIMSTICDAVAYAHERGMIHRDLKPANVMLTPKGQPILMDFGVVKMLEGTHHTATGAIIGTAKYMSPEQARGERPDERTDIYSLGVMLYEMVAGKPPFDAETTVAVLMKHVTQPVPDIRELRNDTPESLVAVIEKALAKKREQRFQTAGEMAEALRACLTRTQPAPQHTVLDSTALGSAIRSSTETIPTPTIAGTMSTAQPQKSGPPMLWIGAAIVGVLLLLAVGGGIFAFSRFTGDAEQTDANPVAAAVAETSEPTIASPEGMVKIPAGTYTIGLHDGDSDHAPIQQVNLNEFWIDRYEVTNAQYAEFVSDTGVAPPADWVDGQVPAGAEKHPVKGVTWEQAAAFCRWAGKRLPAEAEWEAAAREPDGRIFPWGDEAGVVSLPRSGTYEVGSKATNQTPSGLFDMAGNVWEWVDQPYAPVESGNRVLRGGANGFVKDMAFRLQGDPAVPTMFAAAGIRCAADHVDASLVKTEVVEEGVQYRDTFADPGSGWPVLAQEGQLFGYHPPDFYHIELNKPEQFAVITRPPAVTDATIEAEVRVEFTDSETGNFRYGLAVRRGTDDQYYAFVVSYRSNQWQVIKGVEGGQEILAEGSLDNLHGFAPQGFTPDKLDTLRVDAGGPNFAFFVNGEAATRFTDADYPAGEVGFYVETFDETLAHVHYDSLTIRDLAAAVVVQAPAEDTPPASPPPETVEAPPTAVSDTLPTQPPTATPLPPTNTPAPTVTPAKAGPPENMVLIPAGTFLMGSSTGQPNEQPEHQVSLDAFFMDKFEVSNADYRRCVQDGGCTQANVADSFTRSGYRDDPTFNNFPVVGVTWDQAVAYCRWAGKRLPTEAEWEYAASGPDNLTWPWGNSFDPAKSAASAPDTQAVDSHPDGVSPFGVFNMAGNVNEWMQDTFDETFYANSPAQNPVNTGPGDERVFRGGSFANPDGTFYTTSRRYGNVRSFADVDIGFRCAMDTP